MKNIDVNKRMFHWRKFEKTSISGGKKKQLNGWNSLIKVQYLQR